jgi:receptor protein-tyrosine kinase
MSNQIDVVTTNRETLLLESMRTRSSLAVAKMRRRRMQPQAHRELIKLVQRLFLNGPQSTQAVVFSAVEPGGGCTFICTQTAEILANHLEQPVCLVDANFRSTQENSHFEFKNVSDAPQQDEWTLMPVGTNYHLAKTSKFWLVSYRPGTPARSASATARSLNDARSASATARSLNDDCPRLSSLDRFERLIEDLRKDFTYIVIDAPPLNEYDDASLFARMADGLVLVLKAHETRREAAQRAKEMLDASGIPILGAVLNNRTFPIPESLYRRL